MRRIVVLSAALCAPVAGADNPFYNYTIIAKSGQAGLTGFEPALSLGPDSRVAFVGQTQGVGNAFEGIFVGDGSADPVCINPNFVEAQRNFAAGVELTGANKVVARDTFTSDASTFTFIRLWDVAVPNSFTTIEKASNPLIGNDKWLSVFSHPAANFLGDVAFSGIDDGELQRLATQTGAKLFFTTPLRPAISDTGRIVVRTGNQPTDRIRTFDNNLLNAVTIADDTRFSAMGRSPGISPDGDIVVFFGDLTAAGATAFNTEQSGLSYADGQKLKLQPLKAGPGIFARVVTEIKPVVVRLAGVSGNGILDPGETFNDANFNGKFDPGETDIGPFASFNVDARVAVNSTQGVNRGVTVVFGATNTGGKAGIYSTRLSFRGLANDIVFDPTRVRTLTFDAPAPVVEAGQTILGLAGTVQSFEIFDPLNDRDRGDIAFFVDMGGTRAVVRARPNQVVFLDWNPVANYTLDPPFFELFGDLFEDVKVKFGWKGDLLNIFNTLSPNRTDLIADVAKIQTDVTNLVQAHYDAFSADPGAPGVNVRVFGRPGEKPPAFGPYIHVFLGDSFYTPNNTTGISGIANNNLYNQGLFDDTSPQIVRARPLILLDVILHRKNAFFTTQNGKKSKAVGLTDTGPHRITTADIIRAFASTTSHEVGHELGLQHLDNKLNELIMNKNISSPLTDGALLDEMRGDMLFGLGPEALGDDEFAGGTEAGSERLALSVGSDTPPGVLPRSDPDQVILLSDGAHFLYRMSASINPPVSVAGAVAGVVPAGIDHHEPRFISLGAGDLQTLINNTDIEVGKSDRVVILASTDGKGINVFGATAGLSLDEVGEIDPDSVLAAFVEPRFRGRLFDAAGAPLASTLDIYRDTPQGRQKVGAVGDPKGNKAPIAQNDQAQTDAQQSVLIAVLANDSDPDGQIDPKSIFITRTSEDGAAVPDGAGKIEFSPSEGFSGQAVFRYRVRDTKGAVSNEATVVVDVGGGTCYADCDGSGLLDLFDFLCFVNRFNAADPYADCYEDGQFSLWDFLCYVNEYNEGC